MIDSYPNIAIVVLAAGASKRMGEPKQLLKWGDSTLINYSIDSVSKVNLNEIIVVLGAHFELIKNDIKNSKVTILYNQNWEMGLGTSIAFAVQYLKLKVDGVMFVLCDQPFITADFLKEMISKFQPHKNQILATSYGNGQYGVPVLFDKYYFEELSHLNDDYGAKQLLNKYQFQVETLVSPNENMDLDTKQDYTNLYQSKFKKS